MKESSSYPWRWKIEQMEDDFYRVARKRAWWPFWLYLQDPADLLPNRKAYPSLQAATYAINAFIDNWNRTQEYKRRRRTPVRTLSVDVKIKTDPMRSVPSESA